MRVQRVLMPDTVVESWTLLGDDLVPTSPADTSDPADRIDYGPALTWRPTGGHITRTALIGGAIGYTPGRRGRTPRWGRRSRCRRSGPPGRRTWSCGPSRSCLLYTSDA